MSNIAIEAAKEIEKIAQESNRTVLEIIEEYKKAHNFTDQSKSYEHNKTFNDIIPPGTDIDNDQVYIKETGEVLKDLI